MNTLQHSVAPCNIIDELPPEITDEYQPTEADFEWMRAADLDSFVPRNLSFADWIEAKARQAAVLGGERDEWLGESLARLAQLVRWTEATTPAEHEERMEVYERELRERVYADGYAAGMANGKD